MIIIKIILGFILFWLFQQGSKDWIDRPVVFNFRPQIQLFFIILLIILSVI